MNAEQLLKVGSDLVRRCGTRDPFQIAKELGIIVLDDCENFGQLKGMYRVVKKNRFFLESGFKPAHEAYCMRSRDRSRPTAPRTCKR